MRLMRLLLVACIGFVASTGALWGQGTVSSQQIDAANSLPSPDGTRFEGYLYLDIDGQPLPFQSDEEIEAFLAGAKIVETSLVGTGITLPRWLVLERDGIRAHAIFKDVDEERHKVTERINGKNRFSLIWRDWHGYDIAAYILDRLLGMDRVPPAVLRHVKGDSGTLRIWLENTVTENDRRKDLRIEPPDLRRWNQQRSMMQVFDNLVANRDSNLGNLLFDSNWHAWFIDCTRCFGNTKVIYYPLEHIDHCERGVWNGLQNLDPVAVKEKLSPYLSPAEIKSLLTRRDIIVRHFQKLIGERARKRSSSRSILLPHRLPGEMGRWRSRFCFQSVVADGAHAPQPSDAPGGELARQDTQQIGAIYLPTPNESLPRHVSVSVAG